MAVIRPVVLVYQEFATLTVTSPEPDLNCFVVGPAYWIEDYPANKADIGVTPDYGTLEAVPAGAATPVGTPYVIYPDIPNRPPGAVLDASSLQVVFDQARVIIDSRTGIGNATSVLDSTIVDFASVPATKAKLNCATDPAGTNGAWNTVLRAKVAGISGNAIQVALVQDGAADPPTITEVGNLVTVKFKNGAVTATVLNLENLITASSTLVEIDTAGTAANPIVTATAFAATNLHSGTDAVGTTTFTSGAFKVLPGDRLILTDTGGKTIIRTVRAVTSATQLQLTADVTTEGGFAPGTNQKWRIERLLVDQVVSSSFYTTQANATRLNGDVTLLSNGVAKVVSYAKVYLAYRALRTDLQRVLEVSDVNAIVASLGKLDARNPLACGVFVAKQNTPTVVKCFGVPSDDLVGHTLARDAINSRNDIYAIVPLTSSVPVIAMWNSSNMSLALPDEVRGRPQKFRVVIGSGVLPREVTLVEPSSAATTSAVAGTAPVGTRTLTVGTFNFVTADVRPNDKVVIASDTAGTTRNGTYTVVHVNSATSLEVAEPVPSAVTSNASVSVTSNDGLTTKIAAATVSLVSTVLDDLYLVLKDPGGTFLTSGVIPSDVLRVPQAPNGTDFAAYDEFVVDQVLSENRLRIVNNGNDAALSATELPHGIGRYGSGGVTQSSITYQVVRKLDKPGQVTQLVGLSQSFRSRRTIMVWPDLVDVPGVVGGTQQPGFYLACAVGGMTAGLPSHHGFTFLGIAGVSRIYHSSNYFTDEQLTDLMQGGWYVFAQQTETSLPYTIHQLTTDPSTLETGEYSVVKNYDFVAISLSNAVKSFQGVYNVNEQTLSFVRTQLGDTVTGLKTRTYPRIGAPLLIGEVVSVLSSPLSGDRVVAVVNVGLPKPLNVIELHLVA